MTPTERQSMFLLGTPGVVAQPVDKKTGRIIPTATLKPKNRFITSEKYAPCPCGSGEKFKFCCMNDSRVNGKNDSKTIVADKIVESLEEFADELEGNHPVQEETNANEF